MKIADAHCDTLTAFSENTFNNPEAHWTIDIFKSVGGILQIAAIFTPPNYAGDSALRFAFNHIGKFHRVKTEEMNLILKGDDLRDDKINMLLSLEGASPLINEIDNLYAFWEAGIRAITLTWNHRNFLGDGVDEHYGLTHFGKQVVMEMDNLGMIIDVSHLNEKGFSDVANVAKGSFIASHSNSYEIKNSPRNLKDYQIREIASRGGFIGINVYSDFLSDKKESLIDDFIRHVERIIQIGGEDCIGFGADFDGIIASPFAGVQDYPFMLDLLRERMGLDEALIEKIAYKNLYNYVKNRLK